MMSGTNIAAFQKNAKEVALALLGGPNRKMSKPHELRFGSRGSLAVDVEKGIWQDHENGTGGGMIELVMRQKSLDKSAAAKWLRDGGFLPERDQQPRPKPRVVENYDYLSADGEILFRVVRLEPKDFRQQTPDGRGGWKWGAKGAKRVLYRLPRVLQAMEAGETVWIVEGEKSVHALETIGLTATCSPGGAGKWNDDYGTALKGASVVVMPDNDDPGRKHADEVCTSLSGLVGRLRVLTLPDLPIKGDVVDWLRKGGTAQELQRLADKVEQKAPAAQVDISAFPPTEDGIALAFEARFADQLRYDHNVGAWFEWAGSHWKREETRLAYHWCRTIARELVSSNSDGKTAAIMARASAARGVETFAQTARAFAVTSAIWDTDPLLLGTPDGTVDLRTTQSRAARQEDYITRHVAVRPAEQPNCPIWDRFLFEATGGDHEMIRFLRAWCGYCLTGDTREHALLFIYGPGGNGKSVFINTVAGILGDYASNAAMETFVASGVDRHPTDLAMLRGARLVTASETEEGRPWAEARIKQLTGGDTITARFMRQDFFQYRPTFKLMIVGNHKPILHTVDEAMRRRFNILGFERKPDTPDPRLEAKLRDEWPAILRWMIEGAYDWQMNGLVRPHAVVEATAEYFSEQDVLGQWLDTACNVSPEREDTTQALFASWSEFTKRSGEEIGSAKRFSSALQKRGFVLCRNPKGARGQRGFRGLEVKPMSWADQ